MTNSESKAIKERTTSSTPCDCKAEVEALRERVRDLEKSDAVRAATFKSSGIWFGVVGVVIGAVFGVTSFSAIPGRVKEGVNTAILEAGIPKSVSDEVNKAVWESDIRKKVSGQINAAGIPEKVTQAVEEAEIPKLVKAMISSSAIEKFVTEEVASQTQQVVSKAGIDKLVEKAISDSNISQSVKDAIRNEDIEILVAQSIRAAGIVEKVNRAIELADIPGETKMLAGSSVREAVRVETARVVPTAVSNYVEKSTDKTFVTTVNELSDQARGDAQEALRARDEARANAQATAKVRAEAEEIFAGLRATPLRVTSLVVDDGTNAASLTPTSLSLSSESAKPLLQVEGKTLVINSNVEIRPHSRYVGLKVVGDRFQTDIRPWITQITLLDSLRHDPKNPQTGAAFTMAVYPYEDEGEEKTEACLELGVGRQSGAFRQRLSTRGGASYLEGMQRLRMGHGSKGIVMSEQGLFAGQGSKKPKYDTGFRTNEFSVTTK